MEAKTKDLWVYVETRPDGTAKSVGLELLNPGRTLAEKQGGELTAVGERSFHLRSGSGDRGRWA